VSFGKEGRWKKVDGRKDKKIAGILFTLPNDFSVAYPPRTSLPAKIIPKSLKIIL
jgi:hypothetical protein